GGAPTGGGECLPAERGRYRSPHWSRECLGEGRCRLRREPPPPGRARRPLNRPPAATALREPQRLAARGAIFQPGFPRLPLTFAHDRAAIPTCSPSLLPSVSSCSTRRIAIGSRASPSSMSSRLERRSSSAATPANGCT